MVRYLIFFVVLSSTLLFAQTWERTYEQAYLFRDVELTSNYGYIVLAQEFATLLRINEDGDIVWWRDYSDLGTERGTKIIVTDSGGYIIASNIIICTDSLGNTVWTRILPYSISNTFDIQFLFDGNFIVSATTDTAFVLTKMSPGGGILWSKLLPIVPYWGAIAPTHDGGCVFASREKLFFVNVDGNITGFRSYLNHFHLNIISSIQFLPQDSGFIIAGSVYFPDDSNQFLYVARLTSEGDTLWTRVFGLVYPSGVSHNVAFSVDTASDGGFIVVGYTGFSIYDTFPNDYNNVFLLRLNSEGEIIWTREFGTPEKDDIGLSVKQTRDGGFIVAGVYDRLGITGYPRGYLIKTDSLGNVDWVREIPQKPQSIFLNAYPTPFNSSCVISAPAGSDVEIYDVNGRLVWSSSIYGASGNIQRSDSSPRSIVWTPDESVRSGVYFVKATLGGQTMIKRVVLMR